MSERFYPHVFEGEVVHHNVGTYVYTVVFLPAALHAALPLEAHPRLRVDGEVNEIPFEGAWQPVRGRWDLMLSKSLLKGGAIALGDDVEVRFRLIDQNAVDVPVELQRAIDRSKRLSKIWTNLSPGQQRGFSYHVSSAKTEPTRKKRVAEVLEAGRAGRKTMKKPRKPD